MEFLYFEFHNLAMGGRAFARLISCYSRVFEHIFRPGGWEFEQSNFQKFKFPGSARGGVGSRRVIV